MIHLIAKVRRTLLALQPAPVFWCCQRREGEFRRTKAILRMIHAYHPGGDWRYYRNPPSPWKPIEVEEASAPKATLFARLVLYLDIWQLQSW